MANSTSKDHNTAENQQTMQPSTTPVEDQRTLALREAHKKLKRFYTKPAKYMKHGKVPFINLALAERLTDVDKTKKDVKEFLEATVHGIDRYSRSEKTIEYTTILSNTGNDSSKRVLISGSPGSGKTTLAHQLCRDLYSGHLPNQYQLVLFTELKAFRSYTNKKNKKASLLTLLEYSGLPEADSLCSMIEKKEGRGVAIILDGYDEISDDSGKMLTEWVSEVFCDKCLPVSESDVFITTRPSQLSQLAEVASVHLEVLGFSISDIECYIKAYFQGAPDRAEEVIRRLTGLPLVRGLCSNPRVLQIACKVLKHLDEEPLPANLSGIFLRYLRYQLEVDLTQRQPPVKTRIKNLLSVSKELFPGFYTLCSLAYHCCLRQQLMLEKKELSKVKNYINSRGSVYNLLFGEEVDSPSEMLCVLYQCDHKTAMEALAVVHIAVLSPAEQQQIWEEWFTAPHMAQVWMMYCGLTDLKSVDFRRLCSLTVSERSREVAKELESEALLSEDKLVMVSLFEASNNDKAKQVLPVLLKNTIRGYVRSQHDVLCLAYSITHHHHLSRVGLRLRGDCSERLDLQPLTTSLKNVKAVELRCEKMQQIQAVLPEAVEELSLNRDRDGFEISYKGLGDALSDYHCLRSLTIDYDSSTSALILLTELGSVLKSSRLTEFHLKSCGALIRPAADKQRSVASSTETLKNLLDHLEKCSLEMELNDPQISAVLSGLKRADKLKELELNIKPSDPEVNLDPWLVTCDEVEELVATHPHLVKVDVNSTTKSICNKSDLLIAVAKGAIRNENITHLGLGQYETPVVHDLLCLPSAEHITSIRGWYRHKGYNNDDDEDDHDYDDDAWSKGVIAGPMARQTCHLDLWGFPPASLGLLLSRVNRTATKLSLKVHFTKKDYNLVDVRAVKTAFLNCNLPKLRIEHNGRPPARWYHLYSAILNGLAANTTAQVDSCIYGCAFDVEEITRHLSQHTLQRFEVVKTGRRSFIISRDPSCPSGHGSVLLDKCFIPFGIKTVQIDQSGGMYCLEPTTDGVEDHSGNIEQQRSGGDDGEGTRLPEGTDDDGEGKGTPRKSRDIGEGRKEEKTFKMKIPNGALKQEFLEVHSAVIFSGPWRLPEGYTLASPVLYVSFDCTAVTKPIIVRVPHWIAQVSSLSAEDCPLAIAPHELPEDDSKYSFSFLDQESCSVGARHSTIKLSGHCCLLAQAIKESKGQSRYSATAWRRPRESLSGYLFRVPVIFSVSAWSEVLKKYFKDNNWTRDKDVLSIEFEFAPPQKRASLLGTLTKASGPGWAASLNRQMLFPQSYHSMKPDTLEYKLKEDEYPSSFVVTVSEWNRGQNTDFIPVSLIVSGTKLGSMEFPFPVKQAVHLSEADSLPSLHSPPTASRNGSLLEGPTALRTGMDERIGCSGDILGVPEYRKGLIGEMKSLGSVLGIGEDTNATLSRHGSVNDHLVGILDHYIAVKIPTWRDFCKALKRLNCFNSVRAKIEADHDKYRYTQY